VQWCSSNLFGRRIPAQCVIRGRSGSSNRANKGHRQHPRSGQKTVIDIFRHNLGCAGTCVRSQFAMRNETGARPFAFFGGASCSTRCLPVGLCQTVIPTVRRVGRQQITSAPAPIPHSCNGSSGWRLYGRSICAWPPSFFVAIFCLPRGRQPPCVIKPVTVQWSGPAHLRGAIGAQPGFGPFQQGRWQSLKASVSPSLLRSP